MANDNSHPFNSDVIADTTLVQIQKQLSFEQQQRNIQRHHRQRDFVNLLFLNNRNSNFSSSNDSSLSITSHSVTDDDFNRLKYFLRSIIWPIDHHIRRQLWINILTLNRISSSNQNHHAASTGQSLLHRILLTFASHHPDVTYCPTLEPFSALLLHYHNEYEVFYLLNRLLIKNWFCGETHLQWEAYTNVFRKLLKHYYKSSADIIDLRYKSAKVFYQEWLWWIFRYLPFSYLVKIMDCFLLEGPKVLFRISLTLVYLFTKEIKHEFDGNIQNIADFCRLIPISIDRLLHIAFHIRNLKRRTIEQLIKHEEKTLCDTRHQSPSDNINQNNNSGIIPDRQPSLATPHHLTQMPQKSMLDHQQAFHD
ncbi:unnamed protein product [Rotaria sp. Silwood1]|nr:unnamed protein product [Rotaria sp. Silwood1]CAF1603975.1 unnamed protein product [Rotaria sp. Silwood1]CAF3636228.1 unnamed protein product [Rotaria sp. Silwood1]CAF4989331.1 unnamed protein product [Rotaria sp. Silwood1]